MPSAYYKQVLIEIKNFHFKNPHNYKRFKNISENRHDLAYFPFLRVGPMG